MEEVFIRVDASDVLHELKGGLGASWHAISQEIPLHNEKYTVPVREVAPRGSAYGGNPPISHERAWNALENHASWLGLNFLRVELSQRMYEPERNVFDWDNEEMQALYRILDWAEANRADVFLQQMWMNVEWNAIPGIHPLISAPRNLDDFAQGIATLLEHLLHTKGYSCIKYFCMTNEPPGGTWGYWWAYGEAKGDITEAWKRLREELDRRRIPVSLSGPDWTDMPPFPEGGLDFAQYFDAIDIHSYHGVTPAGEKNLARWAAWAQSQGKPFFLTEYGNMNLGWGDDDPGQKSFAAALSNASDVIRGLRAGVDGFNRWSYTNRGDLDGQWQLVQTFDRENRTYLSEVRPEPEAYYGFGIISRFFSKYSATVSCAVSQPDSVLLAAALRSPAGELSVFMVNPAGAPLAIDLRIGSVSGKTLYVYQVAEEAVSEPGFALEAIQSFPAAGKIRTTLPPRSITAVSSYLLSNGEPGIMIDDDAMMR